MAAECQITSMSADGKTGGDDSAIAAIPEGRVGQVCKEWLIREDGNLAYRLQNEEITQHYNENRSKNQIVRGDIPLAKHLQHNEIVEAQRKYERLLKDQMEHDERIAKRIERRLLMEEEAAKKAAEEADERLAKRLMEKEKAKQLKKRLEKEKQQVERLSAQIGADYQLPETANGQTTLQREFGTFSRPRFQRIMTEDEQELDLSEFCMPPPPGLTPEELKLFLEEQDAEIARLLQHQELKRSRNPVKEKMALIEAQDFEIAKMLQKLEKDRYKRIKERFKSQQHRNHHHQDRDSNFQVGLADGANGSSYQRTSTPLASSSEMLNRKVENDYDIPENHLVQGNDTYAEPYQLLNRQHPSSPENGLAQSFHNIAIDLDPTYQRRTHGKSPNLIESAVDDLDDPTETRSAFTTRLRDSLEKLQPKPEPYQPRTSTTSSRSSESSSSSSHRSITIHQTTVSDFAPPLPPRDVSLMTNRKETHRNGSNLLPPHHPQHPNRRTNQDQYLAPIQGQRRISSMEKQTTKISKHKSQDGCKTQ